MLLSFPAQQVYFHLTFTLQSNEKLRFSISKIIFKITKLGNHQLQGEIFSLSNLCAH